MSGAVVAVAVLFADAVYLAVYLYILARQDRTLLGMVAYHLFYTIVTLGERNTCR